MDRPLDVALASTSLRSESYELATLAFRPGTGVCLNILIRLDRPSAGKSERALAPIIKRISKIIKLAAYMHHEPIKLFFGTPDYSFLPNSTDYSKLFRNN